ncbi:MAG: hypothetical protein ACJA1E_000050 [Paracoccaceae bacterium]|jgi:hypothetical protein
MFKSIKSFQVGLAVLATCLTAGVGIADTVTYYDTLGEGPDNLTSVPPSDYMKPTFYGYAADFVGTTTTGTAANITQTANGWGVDDGAVVGAAAGSNLGLVAGNEALVLEFTREVSINYFTLRSYSTVNQFFDLYVDGVRVVTNRRSNPGSVSGGSVAFNYLPTPFTGSVFSFVSKTANPATGIMNTGFYLSTFNVIAEVPLPATAPILAGGLVVAGILLRSRRRTRREAA